MNVLVTGGAGFIGSAFVRHLIAHTEAKVVCLDKLTYAGSLNALASVAGDSRFAFEQADIGDRQAVARILTQYRPDAVVNLAAETHVDRAIDSSAVFVQTNIAATHTLLEAVRDYWQKLPEARRTAFRFHHVSTDEVYGDLADGSADESAPYAPNNPYSASKAAADHLVGAWAHTYGLPVLISRSSNNYGPFQFPEKLIPLAIARALAGQHIPVYGDGLQVRDWLYVDDHARALWQVLRHGQAGGSYNIATGQEWDNLTVLRQLCGYLEEYAPDKPQGISRYADLITHTADRPGHDRRYALDNTKIRRELGWQPETALADGLRETVRWYVRAYLEDKADVV